MDKEIHEFATARATVSLFAMDKHALIESYVVDQIIRRGRIPTRDEMLNTFNVLDSDLKNLDSKHHVLEHLWGFNNELIATFMYKVAESEPKPTDLQGLMYLVAQTELEDMRGKLQNDPGKWEK